MNLKQSTILSLILTTVILSATTSFARTKLVALPERGKTIIRLDNSRATLIEEERILTLQKGLNKIDFSWKGVSIDSDSIRIVPLTTPDRVTLLNVSYPPGEGALIWELFSKNATEINVRISYLLSNIDRLIEYKGIADKDEGEMRLKSFLVLRNFAGEDFKNASIVLDDGLSFEGDTAHEETKQILSMNSPGIPIEKIWTFDAARLPWDPEKVQGNVGIPVSYRINNSAESGLGKYDLWAGKVRIFQDDGHGSTIFLGEGISYQVPVGEEMNINIGDSRDIVVTQQKMRDKRINVRRNKNKRVILYDTDELIKATMENFKDKPATLTLIEHIPGQWDMEKSNMAYKKKDANTIEIEVKLPPQSKKVFTMHYHRRNVR